MLEIKSKLKVARSAYRVEVKGQLRLPFGSRRTGSQRARLVSGEEVELRLPPGEILRGGDLVAASDGRVIEVIADPEKVLHIETGELARVAYHLGNKHVPVQVGDGFLRIAEDHVLEEMVRKLGARVTHMEAQFEPELGAHSPRDDQEHGGDAHDHEHCDHPHHHHRR